MAKDDYFVIVYQILKYLYDCLKKGQPVEIENMTPEALGIPESYCDYIYINLMNQGFVDGVKMLPAFGGNSLDIKKIEITPLGIAYLFENNFPSKIKNTLKDIKDMLPGL